MRINEILIWNEEEIQLKTREEMSRDEIGWLGVRIEPFDGGLAPEIRS